MDGTVPTPLRVALVDLELEDLDTFREAMGDGREAADRARVGLAIAPGRESALWRWAALGGIPRSGEIAALGEVVVEAVVIGASSPRRAAAVGLARALGAAVISLPRDKDAP